MKYWVKVRGQTVEVDVSGDNVLVDGRPARAELDSNADSDQVVLTLDGVRQALTLKKMDSAWHVSARGETATVEVETERSRRMAQAGGGGKTGRGSGVVRAPMPGLVLRIEVTEGDDVAVGDRLVVLEAMKMENVIKSAVAGRVVKVHVGEGVAVEKAALLVNIEEAS